MPSASNLAFVAVQTDEGFGGRFAEELLVVRFAAAQGRIDDLVFPGRDAEEFPFGIGDLLDEGIFEGGVRG